MSRSSMSSISLQHNELSWQFSLLGVLGGKRLCWNKSFVSKNTQRRVVKEGRNIDVVLGSRSQC